MVSPHNIATHLSREFPLAFRCFAVYIHQSVGFVDATSCYAASRRKLLEANLPGFSAECIQRHSVFFHEREATFNGVLDSFHEFPHRPSNFFTSSLKSKLSSSFSRAVASSTLSIYTLIIFYGSFACLAPRFRRTDGSCHAIVSSRGTIRVYDGPFIVNAFESSIGLPLALIPPLRLPNDASRADGNDFRLLYPSHRVLFCFRNRRIVDPTESGSDAAPQTTISVDSSPVRNNVASHFGIRQIVVTAPGSSRSVGPSSGRQAGRLRCGLRLKVPLRERS